MAGPWECWIEPNSGKPIHSFVIVSTEPNELLAPIHNRMPVILYPSNWNVWLGGGPLAAAQALLRPYPAKEMRVYPISAKVNSPKNNGPEILHPVAEF